MSHRHTLSGIKESQAEGGVIVRISKGQSHDWSKHQASWRGRFAVTRHLFSSSYNITFWELGRETVAHPVLVIKRNKMSLLSIFFSTFRRVD